MQAPLRPDPADLPLPLAAARRRGGWQRRIGHFGDVIGVLVLRDQKARYKSTAMGVVWAVASPLLYLATFYFLFAVVLRMQIPNYASHALIGIVAWTWFGAGVTEAVTCIPWNAGLINQPRFPAPALPLAAALSTGVTFLMTFPVLLALVWIDARGPSVAYLALPVVMAVQILVMLALGYLVAALNVLFRDMQHIVPILLQLGYFLTPIFYDTSMVAPALRRVLALNPMFHVVEAYRAILIAGAWPDWPALAAVAALALAGLALTLRYFLRASLRFLEEI